MLNTNKGAGVPKRVARGGRLLKWKGRVASVAPSLLVFVTSLASLSVAAGIASAQTTISTDTTTPVVVDADENITINADVEIAVDGDDAVTIDIESADFTSTFINRGTISTTLTDKSGTGVLVKDAAGNETSPARFENHGTIETTAESEIEDVSGFAIDLDGDLEGVFTNTGTITAAADSKVDFAIGRGIDLEKVTGDFSNSGSITARAVSDEGSADGQGVIVSGGMEGDFSNSKSITVTGGGATRGYAVGTYLIKEFRGDHSNTEAGEISATATASGALAQAHAVRFHNELNRDGQRVGLDVTGNITNDGTVTATATAQKTATGKAYWIKRDLTSNFKNTGTIITDATTEIGLATADGVFIEGNMVGDISNKGEITTNAKGPSGPTAGSASTESVIWSGTLAESIRVNGNFAGKFFNEGDISASAIASAEGLPVTSIAFGSLVKTVDFRGNMTVEDGIKNAGDVIRNCQC